MKTALTHLRRLPRISRISRMSRLARAVPLLALTLVLSACGNSPHPEGAEKTNTLFNSTAERSPRSLDPTKSYSNNETPYTYQIYEQLYQYHYLKRPYELQPKAAEAVAIPQYLDKDGKPLPADIPGEQVAESVYTIKIKKGIKYAPHPAFATDDKGQYLYHAMTREQVGDKRSPWEFEKTGTRELVASDYEYALKRHATTRVEAPVFGTFAEYVIGLKAYGKLIKEEDDKLRKGLDPAALDKPFLDFRKWPLEGVKATDSHTLVIRIKGKYPQWKYWLAMTFAAPIPWEAEAFYAQPGMAANALSLEQWPVGTGPYMMTEFVQDRRHVMKRNPNYRGEPYPCDGMPEDKAAGMLDDCGKMMPFIDEIVTNVIKEKTPQKTNFTQGFLDVPEIERTEWGMDFLVDMDDSDAVKKKYEDRGFKFPRATDISNWYMGFNWYDPVVGKGDTPEQQVRNRKLRQAISIAVDWEEGYGKIFKTKGGEAAHGPLPAGLFGSRHGTVEGHNPVTHRVVDGKVVRRPIEDAKKLLAEAGYPDGRDAKTGKPLTLNYDYQRTPTPEIKAELDWMSKQYAKLGLQLEIRATDYNQFQEKMLKGKQQIFWWGWFGDYPDAENFLFLLYGPNGKAKHEGENAANYENEEYDKLYKRVQLLEDGAEKQKLIDEMVNLVREDAVWKFGYFPYAALAFQPWVYNGKPGLMVRDMARYYRVDTAERQAKLANWNKPVYWPLLGIFIGLAALFLIARRSFKARELATGNGSVKSGAAA
jgi:ABC-type transport system substrate-binding protein